MRPLPVIGAPRSLAAIPLHTTRLSNGLMVVVGERRDLPIVDVALVCTSGAEIDTPATAGRMSMMAEMIDEGTTSRDAIAIAEAFDFLGAHFDIQSGWDATHLALRVLSQHLERATDILSDLVLNPTFPAAEFRRKQQERIGQLQQERDEAAILATKALVTGIFGANHPYAAPIFGTVETTERLDVAATRAMFDDVFHAGNSFLVVVGDVRAASVADVFERQLGRWPARLAQPAPRFAAPSPRATRVLLVDKPGAAQAELRVGHNGPARNTPDYFALLVLNAILGGSFTSRLNTILRERMGVTYGASSRFRFRRHGGVFTAGAAIFTESAARSAQVIIEEMTRMRDELVSEDELRRAQSYIALGLPRQFESTGDIAAHITEQLLYGLPADHWQSYMDQVFAITREDVQQVAARHLQPGHTTITIVADQARVRDDLERAQLGDVLLTEVQT